MLPYFQNGSPATGASGIAQFNASTGATFLWCATARDLTTGSNGAAPNVSDPAARTATRCYMRGLKEKIEIQTSTGLPWQWRRICFTIKAAGNFFNSGPIEIETSFGEQRLLYNLNSGSTTDTTQFNALRDILFRGTYGVDWTSVLNAQVDNSRVTIKYDKTCVVSSGNTSGKLKLQNVWHPMNKTLMYNDDESGELITSSKYSALGRIGMGDYLVVDFIVGGIGGTSSDLMTFNPCATLYWHER